MLQFNDIRCAVGQQFAKISKEPTLYYADIDRDKIVAVYLDSIPAEHNKVYRKQREYDCSCCKQFLRTAGSAVAIIDGHIETIFDGVVADPIWAVVLKQLSDYVKSQPIVGYWFAESKVVGTEKSFEQIEGGVATWNHFFVNVPAKFVKPRDQWGSANSSVISSKDVFERACKELTDEALNIFIELTEQNSLYRGVEFLPLVRAFIAAKRSYSAAVLSSGAYGGSLCAWLSVSCLSEAVLHIRNSAIGTFLVDLSEGTDVDQAVRKYEAVVAPENYHRPTAVVTQKMIDAAKAKAEELGIVSALTRRHAELRDIGVGDVLFVDRDVKQNLKGSLFDCLTANTGKDTSKAFNGVEEVAIDKFISDILPSARKVELLVENKHVANLLTLIAPTDPTANRLFKWDNGFSWVYNGNLADSIKERVKKAGGNVVGELCCRLSWSNYDDLDLHFLKDSEHIHSMYDTDHIYFRNKRALGGELDVDMNAGSGKTREPVENIFWHNLKQLPVGVYRLIVNQYNARERENVGFEVEIETANAVHTFSYTKPVVKDVDVARIQKDSNGVVTITPILPSTQASKNMWGIATQTYVPVELICYSPNFWGDNKAGNKHYIFALKDCKNPDSVRGFLNEYLDSRLTEHRKVFELLGGKTMAPYADNQVSGLGFSSTIRNEILCKVTGATQRIIKLKF